MRKYLFIVNPNAGKKISEQLVETIHEKFPEDIKHLVTVWKDKNDFAEIKNLLLNGGFTHAVAVGGDGTVNEVAKAIIGTKIILCIMPTGSGNGLARTLGLSMDMAEVLEEIAESKSIRIDYGTVNDIPFFCTSGIGFDAHIGNMFVNATTRGLSSYIKITIREIFKYRAKNYEIHVNGQIFKRKAFLITVANAGQYGNDFYIAPQASITDGLFHIAVVKPFNFFSAFGIMAKVLSKKAHLSGSVETFVSDKFKVIRSETDPIHFDGEPTIEREEILFENKSQALKVIVGKNYKPSPEII